VCLTVVVLLGLACAPTIRPTAPRAAPAPPDVAVIDLRSGASLSMAELAEALRLGDFVLLGEVHDNPVHHRLRAELLATTGKARAAAVFEHFDRAPVPLGRPGASTPLADWLDANGFDREGWRWPLHAPLVERALANATALRGSGLRGAALREVVMKGPAAAPAGLRELTSRAPLDAAASARLDAELLAGHCGMLPAEALPGMRAAQQLRDAAMAEALLASRVDGQPWLFAGNGHVRKDLAVPHLLQALVPGARLLSVGFIERLEDGTMPPLPPSSEYDVVVVTPGVPNRGDPCEVFRKPRG
jgi:uncharacterized iron-regulated protein